MTPSMIQEFLTTNQSEVEAGLSGLVSANDPARLYDPVRHVLNSKGKRFRPQLVLCAADAFAGNRQAALQVALGMEVFHIFTLVHDDIMDEADSRRGRPTIHVKWDNPTAILAGDYLLGKASELVASLPDTSLREGLKVFNDAVRILCEGQIRDMEFELRADVTLDEYLLMIDQKTSALLQASLKLGAMTGNPTSDDLVRLNQIGRHLGQAFQIQDDLLDLTADSENWGKPIGGDLISGKKAFLLLEALRLERQSGKGYFHGVQERGGIEEDEVDSARNRMREMGVLETAKRSVIFHSEQALAELSHLPDGFGRHALSALTQKMAARVY